MPRQIPLAILVSTTLLLLVSLAAGGEKQGTIIAEKPKITNVRLVSLSSTSDDKATFVLGISGENLPNADGKVKVLFETKDPASPVKVSDPPVIFVSDRELLAQATARVGTEITRIGLSVENTVVARTEDGLTVSIKAAPPADKPKQFEIKFEHQKNKEFPNLHSIVVTKEGGPPDAGFAANPHWMSVDLIPTGATDVNIVQSNKQRLDLHFVAAADYEPKSVVITVYNSSDLDKREPEYVSIDKKPAAEDPDQPKITGIEIVFIEREQGMGRIRIYGKGFGDYAAPPYRWTIISGIA